ncbi:hypothetical protein KAR91_73510 [Candidatus Pacearchaeota archaeon]|nr:hypothetical protein [Candidatus Pacearchaeota archaeon]
MTKKKTTSKAATRKKTRTTKKATEKKQEKQDTLEYMHSVANKKFSDEDGQALLLHLCDKAGITKWNPLAVNEPLQVNFGERRMIHYLLELSGISPKKIITKYQSNIERSKYEQKVN